jgi:KDO2-lipid IV(A) lauroyltransferase
MARSRSFASWLVARLVIVLEQSLSIVPFRWALAFGAVIGWVMGRVAPFRGRVVRDNLARAFPELSPKERRRLRSRYYVHLGRWAIESLRVGWSSEAVTALDFTVEGQEHADALIAARDAGEGGFIVVSGHMGSWETMGVLVAEQVPLSAIAKPLHNEYLNDHISRSRAGAKLQIIFTLRVKVREISERIRKGEVVVFVADQDERQFGTFVNFMGQPTSTARGPAMMALRTGRPILPCYTYRLKGHRHQIVIFPPIWPPDSPEVVDQAVQAMTQEFTERLESIVRLRPEQYFWIHRRWKTRPEHLKIKRHRRAGLATQD